MVTGSFISSRDIGQQNSFGTTGDWQRIPTRQRSNVFRFVQQKIFSSFQHSWQPLCVFLKADPCEQSSYIVHVTRVWYHPHSQIVAYHRLNAVQQVQYSHQNFCYRWTAGCSNKCNLMTTIKADHQYLEIEDVSCNKQHINEKSMICLVWENVSWVYF
jgi:hypothetical protein